MTRPELRIGAELDLLSFRPMSQRLAEWYAGEYQPDETTQEEHRLASWERRQIHERAQDGGNGTITSMAAARRRRNGYGR